MRVAPCSPPFASSFLLAPPPLPFCSSQRLLAPSSHVLTPPPLQYAAVAYGGGELSHNGRYDLLPYLPDQMEWVPARDGKLPEGRRVVEGG